MKRALWGLVGLVVTVAASAQSAEGAAAPAAPGPDANGAYTLNLNRPWAKGETYTLSVDVVFHADGGSGQDVEFWTPQHKDQHVVFLGKVRLLDVNATGEGTTLVVHVDKASVTEKDKTRALKMEGSDLGVSFNHGQVNFGLKDGQPIPPPDLSVLKQVFPPPKEVGEADYLSPNRPVRPGEQWAVNRDALAKALTLQGVKGTALPSVTDGTVQFVGPETVEGAEFLHLVVKWGFRTGDTDRFYGTNVTQVSEDLYLPRDPASRFTRRTTDISGRVNGRVRNEANQLLEVKGTTKVLRKTAITAG
jgi:hypothetical protein